MSRDDHPVETLASRNPPWDRDETILAFDLYLRRRPRLPDQKDAEIVALSDLLNLYARKMGMSGNVRLRNPNGVSMKVANLSRWDEGDQRAGLAHGAKLEGEVWKDFGPNLQRLADTANAIRIAIGQIEPLKEDVFPIDPGLEEATEGKILTRLHHSRERNKKLVLTKKLRTQQKTGGLACEGCGFDFLATYGQRGEGFIEAHHTRPLHQFVAGDVTRLDDLALICANCHRMIHVNRPWLTMEELRAIVEAPTAA